MTFLLIIWFLIFGAISFVLGSYYCMVFLRELLKDHLDIDLLNLIEDAVSKSKKEEEK